MDGMCVRGYAIMRMRGYGHGLMGWWTDGLMKQTVAGVRGAIRGQGQGAAVAGRAREGYECVAAGGSGRQGGAAQG